MSAILSFSRFNARLWFWYVIRFPGVTSTIAKSANNLQPAFASVTQRLDARFFGWSALPLRHASHKQTLIVFRCFFDDHGTLAPLRWMRQPEPFSFHGKGVPITIFFVLPRPLRAQERPV